MSPLIPPLLAALPEYPTVGQTLSFQLNGLMVVFLTLGSIWFLLSIIGTLFRLLGPKTAPVPATAAASPAAAPVTAQPVTTPESAGGPSPHVVAAIAAAVYATMGGRVRIAAITPSQVDGDWAREGRRQIFASHRVR